MDTELSFCIEHAGRTCCSREDTNAIWTKFEHARQKATWHVPKTENSTELVEMGLSNRCQTQLLSALCSTCDGEIGTGVAQGLCGSFCERIYTECSNEYLDLSLLQQKKTELLPFCREDSLMCQRVGDIVSSPQKFCKMMGFSVVGTSVDNEEKAKPEEDKENKLQFLDEFESTVEKMDKLYRFEQENVCFDGFPSLGRRYHKLSRTKEQSEQAEEKRKAAQKRAKKKQKENESYKKHELELLAERLFTDKDSWAQWLILHFIVYPIVWFETFWERKLKGVVLFLIAMVGSLCGYELFVNHKLCKKMYKYFCGKKKGKGGIGDIAVQERLRYLENLQKEQKDKEQAAKEKKKK